MGIHGMQEGVAGKATRIAGRVVRASVAGYRVTAGVAFVRIVDAELGVIENVERFHAELEIAAFRDFEVLQEGNIEVQTTRVVHKIASGISKSKTFGSGECCRIAQDGAKTLIVISTERSCFVRVSDHIRIGSGARPVGYSGVVEH